MKEENTLQLIENQIYEIRGVKVMLDFDLAEMYGMETRVLKQAVRRNIKRFEGQDFMFEVSWEELSRSQFVILNRKRGGNIKYKPFAFTELGVAMLSSVHNSDIAIEVNRNIMRTFVAMRKLLLNSPETDIKILQHDLRQIKSYIEEIVADQNDINEDTRMQMELINEAIAELRIKNKTKKLDEVGYLVTLERLKK